MPKVPPRSSKTKPAPAPAPSRIGAHSPAPASATPPPEQAPHPAGSASPRAPRQPVAAARSSAPKPPRSRGETRRPKLAPVDELEERLREPEEGAFLHGLEKQVVYYPTLIEQITDAGERIVEALYQYDSPALWHAYEQLEGEFSWVRERAAFGLGWQHGSADGRAEAFRRHAPGLSKRAKRLADQARALVVNGGLRRHEAIALLLETAWAIALAKPAPAFEG